MESGRIKLDIFVASTAAAVCFEVAARWAGSALPSMALVFTGFARLATVAAILLIVRNADGSLETIGLKLFAIWPGCKRGVFWSAGFGAIAAVGFVVCYLVGIDPLRLVKVQLPDGPTEVFLYFAVGAALAPLAEEIYFRGVLFGYLRRWGLAAALAGSTLLFVAVHPNLQQIPVPQIVGGLVFASAYEVEKNLMVPIVIHAAGNLALFSLSLIG